MRNARSILVTTCTILVSGVFLGFMTDGYVQATASGTYSYVHLFTEVLDEVKRNYVDDIDAKDLVHSSIRGMMRDLDAHSVFLDETAYGELRIDTKGSFGGLGIVISIRDDFLTVMSPMEGTPAWQKGIEAGDRIVAIEGEPTDGITTEEAVTKLRGPKGTDVTITIARAGISDPFDFTITRDVIAIKSIPFAGVVGDRIGYVRLVNFSEVASEELALAMEDLLDQDVRAMILDLRNNSGGLLEQAVAVADLFVEKGKLVVYTKGRHPSDSREWAAPHRSILGEIPLVVMVNDGTASASEIVSGAIQDYDIGVVLGVSTYGKGSVQTVRNLSSGTALKLTTALYYTPSGRSIHRPEHRSGKSASDEDEEPEHFKTESGRPIEGGGGIKPDVVVEAPEASRLLIDILRKDLFFKFAVEATSSDRDLGDRPRVSDEMLYLGSDHVASESYLAEFSQHLREAEIEFDDVELEEDREYIVSAISRQIATKLHGMEAGYRFGLEADHQLGETIDLLDGVLTKDDLWVKVDETRALAAADPERIVTLTE